MAWSSDLAALAFRFAIPELKYIHDQDENITIDQYWDVRDMIAWKHQRMW